MRGMGGRDLDDMDLENFELAWWGWKGGGCVKIGAASFSNLL